MEITNIELVNEDASLPGTDGRMPWFRVNDSYDFFIPISRTALSSQGLSKINWRDLLISLENNLRSILEDYTEEELTTINPREGRFRFQMISNDYGGFGDQCLMIVHRDHKLLQMENPQVF